jgi:hypothetical protein
MKKIFTSKILRKVAILSFLIVGLVFVVSSDNTQTVQAAPCCSSCPGGGDVEEMDMICYNQCGGFNTCFYNCRNQAMNCYRVCVSCSGGGGFDECQFDTQCLPGSFCVNNHCTP